MKCSSFWILTVIIAVTIAGPVASAEKSDQPADATAEKTTVDAKASDSAQIGQQLGKDLATSGLETEEGTLYPILRRLEQQGQCTSSWDTGGNRPRKYYQTTDKGIATLKNLLVTFRRIGVALDTVVNRNESGDDDE